MIFTRYCDCDQIVEGQIGGACSMLGRNGWPTRNYSENLTGGPDADDSMSNSV